RIAWTASPRRLRYHRWFGPALPLLSTVTTRSGWWQAGASCAIGQDVSNHRRRMRPRKPGNMQPQRMMSGRMGAPGTFSMTHGRPVASRASRVGATSSGYALPALRDAAEPTLHAWHGGLAWMVSYSWP